MINSKNRSNISCQSRIGRHPGKNIVYLKHNEYEQSCMSSYTVTHELFHALGLHHEHNRLDRDEYVIIHYEHMKSRLFDIFYFSIYCVLYKNLRIKENGKGSLEKIVQLVHLCMGYHMIIGVLCTIKKM